MEENKNSKGLIFLIVILIIVIIGLIGYIFYEKNNIDKIETNATTTLKTNKDFEENITEKIITFSDLNLIETKDYSKDYKVLLNDKQVILNISNSFTNFENDEYEGEYKTIFSLDGKVIYTFVSDTATGLPIYGIAVYNNSYIAIIEDTLSWDQIDTKKVTFVNEENTVELKDVFNINDGLKFEKENIYYYTQDITKNYSCITGGTNIDIYNYKTSISNNKLNNLEKINFIETKTVTCGEE